MKHKTFWGNAIQTIFALFLSLILALLMLSSCSNNGATQSTIGQETNTELPVKMTEQILVPSTTTNQGYTIFETGIEPLSSSDNEPVTETPIEQVVWNVDITHDGKDDRIVVDIMTNNYGGEGARVYVYESDTDNLLYELTAFSAHVGWNGLYLYCDGNNSSSVYLLNWIPAMWQGFGIFGFEVFSFDENGDKIVYDSDSLEFNIFDLCFEYKGLEEFVRFIHKVNYYLMQSWVVADTNGGTLLYGTQDSKTVNPYVPEFLFTTFGG